MKLPKWQQLLNQEDGTSFPEESHPAPATLLSSHMFFRFAFPLDSHWKGGCIGIGITAMTNMIAMKSLPDPPTLFGGAKSYDAPRIETTSVTMNQIEKAPTTRSALTGTGSTYQLLALRIPRWSWLVMSAF